MGSPEKLNILIVDDTQDILDYLYTVFVKAGFLVTTADCGNDAFEIFCRHSFDAVLTDVQMPNGSGLDLLLNIKRVSGATPVFLFTGDVAIERTSEAARRAEAILLKPMLGRDILRAVSEVLPQRISEHADSHAAKQAKVSL